MDEKEVRTTLPEFIFFTDEPGRSNVVCFTNRASTILSKQLYEDREENFNDEKVRIVTAAANLIKNETRCIRYETNVYPSKADIELVAEFLPQTLKLFIKVLVGQGLKRTSLGQCILKAMKRNIVIPPLLFGLSVVIDHAIGSKTLLTEISKLGYAISYNEVKRYKQSVLMDEDHKLDHLKDRFPQFVADNVEKMFVCFQKKYSETSKISKKK